MIASYLVMALGVVGLLMALALTVMGIYHIFR